MQRCFSCSNYIEIGTEGFLPSSCGKCDDCLENCPVLTQEHKRGAVRDLPACTAAISGNGLSMTISADDSFSRPDTPVSVSLNAATSFHRTSVAQHSCVDQTLQRATLDGQSLGESTLMCDQQEGINSQIQNEAAVRALVKADYASEFAKRQALDEESFYREFGSYTGLISTPGISVQPGSFQYM